MNIKRRVGENVFKEQAERRKEWRDKEEGRERAENGKRKREERYN